MRINKPISYAVKTHEGGAAVPHLSSIQKLRRSVLSTLLWEKQFYEDGFSIADRIESLADQVTIEQLADLTIEARSQFNLRHTPLLLLRSLVKRTGSNLISKTITATIQRPDELTEFLALYWQKGKRPLSKQIKIGLAAAFGKFDEYQLAKWGGNK